MANRTAVIQTNKGTIRVELLEADAPKTTENFITLAQRGYYDGIIFHRVIKGFMIQGGDPTAPARRRVSVGRTLFDDEINPLVARLSERLQGGHDGDGQRWSKHQRIAVLHHARRLPAAAELHDLWTRHGRSGRRECDCDHSDRSAIVRCRK